jgi:hypothetical protein
MMFYSICAAASCKRHLAPKKKPQAVRAAAIGNA